MISHDEAVRLIEGPAAGLDELLARAAAVRDARGGVVTFSAKVFVPLTTPCRDDCGYCTFRRDPGQPGALAMTPEEVVALCQAGARLGAKEALFSLGDRPEARFVEHREFLRAHGHRTTLSYLRQVCAITLADAALLPHVNPGLMTERDLAALREVSVSMGLMLETTSERLLIPGGAHHRAPDKVPRRRLKTIELAGKLSIPFTTGILIGIGETPRERADAPPRRPASSSASASPSTRPSPAARSSSTRRSARAWPRWSTATGSSGNRMSTGGAGSPGAALDRASRDVRRILDGALAGGEVSVADGHLLARAAGRDLLALSVTADELRRRQVGDTVTFVVNRNVNFTNVCIKHCTFCAFSRDHREEEGYLLPVEEIVRRAQEAWDLGATEVCIQAGLPPKLDGRFYIDLARALKAALPDIHLHAFSPG